MRSLFLVLLLTVPAVAAFKSENHVSAHWKKGKPGQIVVDVDRGFHINEKAPNVVDLNPEEALNPAKTSARQMTFAVPKPSKSMHVSIYVCDDALTVCENREVDL